MTAAHWLMLAGAFVAGLAVGVLGLAAVLHKGVDEAIGRGMGW